MGVEIKKPEDQALIRELARRTGRSEADAVVAAVREQLARLPPRRQRPKGKLAAELMRIGREAAARMAPEERAMDYDALLYDEWGLPK